MSARADQAATSGAFAIRVGIHDWEVGVLAKRTYRFGSNAVEVDSMQVPLVREVRPTPAGGLEHDTDLLFRKPGCDVVLDGHAYSRGRRRRDVVVSVGDVQQRATVLGDRSFAMTSHGVPAFSEAAPWERVRLDWENAYGGADLGALSELGDPIRELLAQMGKPYLPRSGRFAYPRNRLGRGYVVRRPSGRIDEGRLPNVEPPEMPLTPETLVRPSALDWPRGPLAVGFGWMPYDFFPRSVLFNHPPPPYDLAHLGPDDFIEVRAGMIGRERVRPPSGPRIREVDLRIAHGAPPALRAREIRVGDRIHLVGVLANHDEMVFPLAIKPPKLLARVRSGDTIEPTPVIKTIVIEPDHGRLTVLWAGVTTVRAPIDPLRHEELEHAVIWS